MSMPKQFEFFKAKAGVKRHQKNHVRKRRAAIQNQISNTA